MMHIINVHRDTATAYVAWQADHRDACHLDGEVRYGESCACPEWATNIEVPLDEVEAKLGRLPDGYQEPWPVIHPVRGRVRYDYATNPQTGNPVITGTHCLVRFSTFTIDAVIE